MADSVNTNVVFKGTRKVTLQLSNLSDGTGEAAVVKFDASTYTMSNGAAPSAFIIESVIWAIQGFSGVRLYFDATTDDEAVFLPVGFGYFDWQDKGGVMDPKSSGTTGDIVLTTAGAVAGATYDITMTVRLKA
jgi:hypothetical protein